MKAVSSWKYGQTVREFRFIQPNFLENEAGRNGAVYQKRDAVCLETQNYPDAVHQKNFPEAICKKGETYDTKTAYRFHIE